MVDSQDKPSGKERAVNREVAIATNQTRKDSSLTLYSMKTIPNGRGGKEILN